MTLRIKQLAQETEVTVTARGYDSGRAQPEPTTEGFLLAL